MIVNDRLSAATRIGAPAIIWVFANKRATFVTALSITIIHRSGGS